MDSVRAETVEVIAGKYKIIGQIGKGGVGTVFLAEHIALNIKVVLKRIFSVNSNTAMNRMEIDILKNLQNEHLPRVYDFIVEDGYAYSVMEYISGKSFDKLIEEGRIFKENEIIQWAKELCRTLTYLHSQKPPVLHCDIKPANLILSESGKIYLIDFNISSYLEKDSSKTYGYTKRFASPEQVRLSGENVRQQEDPLEKTVTYVTDIEGKADTVTYFRSTEVKKASADLDERTDIYSLGATLLCLLHGSFQRDKTEELVSKLRVCKRLKKILLRALEPDRENRYPSAGDMLEDLNRISTRSVYKGLIAAGLLLIVVGIAAFFPRNGEESSALLEQADGFFEDGQYEQAVLLYQDLAVEEPDAVIYPIKIADCYYNIGSIDRALEFMQEQYRQTSQEIYRDKILEYLFEKCQMANDKEEWLAWAEERVALGERSRNLFDELLEYYSSISDYDNVRRYVDLIHKENIDADTEKYEEMTLLVEKNQSVLHELYEACSDLDIERMYDSCLGGDFYKMTRIISQPYFYDEGKGLTLGIYNSGYLYLGEMENGMRQGKGKWIGIDGLEFFVYEGDWTDDLPNGYGKFRRVSYAQEESYESAVINGIMDGSCEVTYRVRINQTQFSPEYAYTYVNHMGHPVKVMENIFDDVPENYIIVSAEGDMMYFEPENELKCVWGLGLEGY